MTETGCIFSLIKQVYTAAADASHWQVVLAQLANEYRGSVAGFQQHIGNDVRSATFVHLDPRLVEVDRIYYAMRNPWRPFTYPRFYPGVVIPTKRLLPVTELYKTEFCDGILRPARLLPAIDACVAWQGSEALSFTVLRSSARGPFQEPELQRVVPILPHLHRAVQINRRLGRLQQARTGFADGLESLRHGVIVINRDGRAIFANRAARAIVAQNDGLTITDDGLVTACRADRVRLRSLLDNAMRTTKGQGLGAGGAMPLSRPSLKRPFSLLVAPLSIPFDTDEPRGLATIFVSDPDQHAEPVGERMTRIYGLSAAEARVVNAFVATGNLEQAADNLRISCGTARWHLKRIYRKTGTARQSALLRLLLGGATRLPLETALAESSSASKLDS